MDDATRCEQQLFEVQRENESLKLALMAAIACCTILFSGNLFTFLVWWRLTH